MPRVYSHWRYNTVCSPPTHLRLQAEPRPAPPSHPQHRWPEEDTGEAGVICPQGLGLWSVFTCIYLSVWLWWRKKGMATWCDMETQPSTVPEVAWQPALGDVWKPRQRTWIWGGGAQICFPLRQRWLRRGGNLRCGLGWWEAALRFETLEWPETQRDVCGSEEKPRFLCEFLRVFSLNEP